MNGNDGSPKYMAGINAESNTVTVGAEEEQLRTRPWVSGVSFTSGKIRYNAPEAPATICPDGE